MQVETTKLQHIDAGAAKALDWLRTGGAKTGYGFKIVGAALAGAMLTVKAQVANAGGYAVHPKIVIALSAVPAKIEAAGHMIGYTAQQCAPGFLASCDTVRNAVQDGKVVLHDPLLSTMAAAALFIPISVAYLAFKK